MTFLSLKMIIFGNFSRFLASFKISFPSLQHPTYKSYYLSVSQLVITVHHESWSTKMSFYQESKKCNVFLFCLTQSCPSVQTYTKNFNSKFLIWKAHGMLTILHGLAGANTRKTKYMPCKQKQNNKLLIFPSDIKMWNNCKTQIILNVYVFCLFLVKEPYKLYNTI